MEEEGERLIVASLPGPLSKQAPGKERGPEASQSGGIGDGVLEGQADGLRKRQADDLS